MGARKRTEAERPFLEGRNFSCNDRVSEFQQPGIAKPPSAFRYFAGKQEKSSGRRRRRRVETTPEQGVLKFGHAFGVRTGSKRDGKEKEKGVGRLNKEDGE